jgi:hypothetical protein
MPNRPIAQYIAAPAVTERPSDGTLQSSLPMRKRKQEVMDESSDHVTTDPVELPGSDIMMMTKVDSEASLVDACPNTDADLRPMKRQPMSKAREVRLEQNRKAARESRRRKKIMIDELQRSVVFFSRANGTLKQQNDELQRMLLSAQARVQAYEKGDTSVLGANGAGIVHELGAVSNDDLVNKETREVQAQQAVASAQAQAQAAQAAATQAMFQNQGFPPAAARAAAQTFVAGPPPTKENDQMAANAAAAEAAGNNVQAQIGAWASVSNPQQMQNAFLQMQQLTQANPMYQNAFIMNAAPIAVSGNVAPGQNNDDGESINVNV